MLRTGMWNQKRQILMEEVEAESSKWVLLPPFILNMENLNVVQVFVKYDEKLLLHKPAFAKNLACGSLDRWASTPPLSIQT